MFPSSPSLSSSPHCLHLLPIAWPRPSLSPSSPSLTAPNDGGNAWMDIQERGDTDGKYILSDFVLALVLVFSPPPPLPPSFHQIGYKNYWNRSRVEWKCIFPVDQILSSVGRGLPAWPPAMDQGLDPSYWTMWHTSWTAPVTHPMCTTRTTIQMESFMWHTMLATAYADFMSLGVAFVFVWCWHGLYVCVSNVDS